VRGVWKRMTLKNGSPYLKELAILISDLDDGIYEIVLFGSLASGKFHTLSDIDLVCLFDPDFEDPDEGW
jgi:predicted nucleotidyltransferase